ncbi:hypothetical protein BABA_13942 [Neobacillus bataviensis LMG 21833]|uniref:Uncharacterized protein n=1 Tax=Neobacillus bataviensis LMG 21833 TaxID=1117379 RepID=K6C7B3_9BACI|nr:hypothetical protein [Neobacillus bataviensis]EKN66995.1 hypothetical protein BABA_13942 [Neobacillus bataviensis LMG 21833]
MPKHENFWYQYLMMIDNEGFTMSVPEWLDDGLVEEFNNLVEKYSRFDLFQPEDGKNLARFVTIRHKLKICKDILLSNPSYLNKSSFMKQKRDFECQMKLLEKRLNLNTNNIKAIDKAIIESKSELERFSKRILSRCFTAIKEKKNFKDV